jgi:hypothetical protein
MIYRCEAYALTVYASHPQSIYRARCKTFE